RRAMPATTPATIRVLPDAPRKSPGRGRRLHPAGRDGSAAAWRTLRPAGALRSRPQGHHQLNRVNTDKMRMQKCRSGRSATPVGACTAEEKKEFAEMNLTDHAGVRLTHGKPKVNGVEIHYAIGGAGEPVCLLHGVPKTMSYWRHVVPLLTPHYTVIAVDNRGFG